MNNNITRLQEIMAKLRDPETGCKWDIKQNFQTIAPYVIEEAYEVVDAINNGDMDELRDELGDLLLQVIFHSRIAEEDGIFNFNDVAGAVADKMINRHPHIFNVNSKDNSDIKIKQIRQNWEDIKAKERQAKVKDKSQLTSAIDGVAMALPSLMRAEKLTKRAASVGFDWTKADDIFAKIEEEIAELRQEIKLSASKERLRDELGDLLFCMANLARHLNIDAEESLRDANAKFSRRFKAMEEILHLKDERLSSKSLDEMEKLWQIVKHNE